MSDLTVREMTMKEAETAIKGFIGSWTDARGLLLEMFDRKAHKALGYGDFEEFAQERLGITSTDKTIRNHLTAARVERNLIPIDSTKRENISSFAIPLSAAIELNKLPEDQQREAWKEVKTLESFGTHLPKQIARALRDIVARRLNRASIEIATPAPPPPAPIIISPSVPIKPRVPIKPIVPETYDSGPEHDDQAEPAWLKDPSAATPPQPVVIEPAVVIPTAPPPPTPNTDTVSRIQYEALFCITRAFAGAVDRADKDAAIEARVDFKNFLKEWGQ